MSELSDILVYRTDLRPQAALAFAARLDQHPDVRAALLAHLDGKEADLSISAGPTTLGQLLEQYGTIVGAATMFMDLRDDPSEVKRFLARGWDKVGHES